LVDSGGQQVLGNHPIHEATLGTLPWIL